MNKLILFLLFFYRASAFEIRSIEAIIEEVYESKSMEYKLKVLFPSKLYKEILKPLNKRGELYIYNDKKKIIYYPSINYILKEDVKDDKFLRVLNDIKKFFEIKSKKNKIRRRNVLLQFKDNRLYLIKYPNNIKILLKDYKLFNDVYFPQKIEILDKSEKIVLNIKSINFNLNLKSNDFEVTK